MILPAHHYLVTTHCSDLPQHLPLVMVDGTVPHWQPRTQDQHYDHHKPGGAPVQILEIPDNTRIAEQVCFVTTQVDADACAAATWLQLLALQPAATLLQPAHDRLCAIAYECDHLGQPPVSPYMELTDFARNAVATLKLFSNTLIPELGLPQERSTWSDEQKSQFASRAFQKSSEWLLQAALGSTRWPGEAGEAAAYWAQFHQQRPQIWARCRLIKAAGMLDQRGITTYVDPRHLIDWTRQQEGHSNLTLTVRDRICEISHATGKLMLPGYSYTLGSIPLHALGSPRFSEHDIWRTLAQAEATKRQLLALPPAGSSWGGRNEVGGSGWNDAALLLPEEVITCALQQIALHNRK